MVAALGMGCIIYSYIGICKENDSPAGDSGSNQIHENLPRLDSIPWARTELLQVAKAQASPHITRWSQVV